MNSETSYKKFKKKTEIASLLLQAVLEELVCLKSSCLLPFKSNEISIPRRVTKLNEVPNNRRQCESVNNK
jgi:hypothetical protein